MMKKASKLLALCLSVLMLVSALTVFASADFYERDCTANGCRRITGERTYKDDGTLNSDSTYTFDEAGRLLCATEFDFEFLMGKLIGDKRRTYTYNENGDVLTFTNEYYNYNTEGASYGQAENWYISEKRTYTYNADGTLREEVKFSGSSTTSELKPDLQYTYTYEGNVRTTLESHSHSGVMEITDKTVDTLDANGNVTAQSKFVIEEGVERLYKKFEYEYDANGNKTLERSIDVDEGEEEPEYERRWTYNDHGDKLSYTEAGYHSVAGTYIPEDRTRWIYDAQYRVLETIEEEYGDGDFHMEERHVLTYFDDAPERLEKMFYESFEGSPLIASESYYEWSSSLKDMRLEYQYVYTLSADKLSVEEVYSRYDDDTQKFENRSKTVVTATDDTYTSFSPKHYDYDEGQWVEDTEDDPYRTDLTYDEDNNVTSYQYYAYDSETSTWKALNKYTISYSEPIYHTNLKKVDAVDATCDHAGHGEYYVCECGQKAFLDKEGKNKIENLSAWLDGEGKVDTLPHEYDENGICKNCGAKKPAKGLSVGAIIGIILGSLVLLALIAYVVIFFIWKKKEELPEALAFLGFLVPSYKAINNALFKKKESKE